MKLLPANQDTTGLQKGLIVSAALGSIIVGAAYLVFDSPFSSLFVVGLFLGILLALIWIRMPVIALYSALFVVLLPLGLLPASIQSILNRFLTLVALFSWQVNVIVRRRRIVWTNTGLLMLVFLAWCLLSLLWSKNLIIAANVLGGYTLRFVLFLFLFTNEINTRKTLDGIMHTLAIAGWLYIVIGIGVIFFQGYESGTRLQVLGENANTFGGLFPVVAVGVIWLAIRTPNPRRELWIFQSLAFLLLSFGLIALSGSRGGAISWLITILALFFWRPTRLWGIVGILILLVVVISAPFILATTIDRFVDRTSDTLLGGREALWQAAWMLIRDHPWKGVGVGNAPFAMMSYVRMFRSVWGYDLAAIHNPFLTLWAETGILGLILYLGVLVSSLWAFFKQYDRNKKLGIQWLTPYFALTASAFLGYFTSWIKGGGMELGYTYFLMLALLLIPSGLNIQELSNND
jgi:putative inorganic carbon (hco3(-)) transporter